MNIGERIKERRKELGLSADTIAYALGKDRSTIYRYEGSDIEKFPTTILEPLADILNTTPAYLMGWSDKKDVKELNKAECSLLTKYNSLNIQGKNKADEYMDDLLDNPKYSTVQNEDIEMVADSTEITILESDDESPEFID